MFKAGIITHYDVHNHGAQLQLYALCAQLKKMGYDAKALTYKKNYDFMEFGAEYKYSITVRSIPFYIKYLVKNGIKKTYFNYKKRRILNKFRADNKIEGEFYSKAKDLDVVVLGSDEIFSIESGLNPWFWGMGVPCKKIISYAASFGPITDCFIKEHYANEFIESGLKRINCISVRDINSYNISSLRTNKPISIVCDPVILYDFKDELNQYSNSHNSSEYCIVYSYDNNMNDLDTIQAIRLYAKKKRIRIYSIGYYHKWCDKNINASPLELINWFKNARCVFTDTFHGTVISLICNVNFVVKLAGNKNKLAFLLEQYGVMNRCVEKFSNLDNVISSEMDYKSINMYIEKYRTESIEFLNRALEVKL